MKLTLVFIMVLAACILWPADVSQGACPEEPNDHGACDTMYVELYPPDAMFTGAGHLVRVPVFITNDIPDAMTDSIAGMTIPLCYTRTNPAVYCSLPPLWNRAPSYIPGGNSILRHLDDTTLNAFCQTYPYPLPDDFVLDINTADQYFRFAWHAISPTSPRWPGGSRQLAFIMTFKVEDSMTVCVDTCFWPPTGQLLFVRSPGVTYVPRDNLPYCFSISYPDRGDCNCDGIVDIGDVVYLIGYLYRNGPAPTLTEVGDSNCDGIVDVGDVVRLIGYLYKGEPPPSC
ncbi:MAG: dockerin type I repeat-containing protein [Candidatus Zixiibacteriota bacterium]